MLKVTRLRTKQHTLVTVIAIVAFVAFTFRIAVINDDEIVMQKSRQTATEIRFHKGQQLRMKPLGEVMCDSFVVIEV